MNSKFPGLDQYIMNEKVSDIENSITSSLINNSERKKCELTPFYIIGFICICLALCSVAAIFTYVFIKM